MLIDDIEDKESVLIIKIPNTKTNISRTFIVSNGGVENTNYISFYRKYVELRPPNTPTRRFFLRYKNGICNKQVVGMNIFANMPKQIASFLNLPNVSSYTGHCFRRSSATLLADAGASITTLKRLGGWRSATTAEGYIEDSIQNKTQISEKILGKSSGSLGNEISYATTSSAVVADNRNEPIIIQNCKKFTINYIVHNNSENRV